MITAKVIAFQTSDPDSRSTAFVFNTEEEAEAFLSNVLSIMAVLELSLQDGETAEKIQSTLRVHRVRDKLIGISFMCEETGGERLSIGRMLCGFHVSGDKQV